MRFRPTYQNYISIVGPDGSGKTTLAILLGSNYPRRIQSVVHKTFSFDLLPPLGTLFRRRSKPRSSAFLPSTELHSGMVTPLPATKANILAIWYGLDHIFGHIPLLLHRKRITIQARSYYDFFYQLAYRNASRHVINLFVLLGPRPLICICPARPAASIYSSKPELTIDEINNQYSLIQASLVDTNRATLVNADDGPDALLERILLYLHNLLQ